MLLIRTKVLIGNPLFLNLSAAINLWRDPIIKAPLTR